MTAGAEIKEHPLGEAGTESWRVGFDRTVKLEFHGVTVSSDAGLLPYRDLDDAVQLTESAAAELLDFRTNRNVRHSMTALLRQSVYSRLTGHEDVNDADRPSVDPVMRQVIGSRAFTRRAASISQVGHFECGCYHPLFCFNQFGDVERALLRNGNVASADDWRSVLEPIIARYRDLDIHRFFRGDAACAIPDLYEALEAEGYLYVIRLKGNEVLYREIEFLLVRWADRRTTPSSGVTTSPARRAAGTVVLVADCTRTRSDRACAPRERRYSGGERPGVAGRSSNGECRLMDFADEL
ncbi:MAG: transposase [Planctomycetota bacterium]|nr:MAG: transposase [Planctomycetota bacterium]